MKLTLRRKTIVGDDLAFKPKAMANVSPDHQATWSEILIDAIEIDNLPHVKKPIIINDAEEVIKLYLRLNGMHEKPLVLRFQKSLFLFWNGHVFLHNP